MFDAYDFIDMTHTLCEGIPSWDLGCGFNMEVLSDFDAYSEFPPFRVQRFKAPNGIGTHIDAPLHCFPEGKSVADIPIAHLIKPAVILDVSSKADEHYQVSVGDLMEHESRFGEIPSDAILIIYTGWEKRWYDVNLYCNEHRFPSVNIESARFLLKRQIAGLGIDTLSPDRPEDGFPVHAALLRQGTYLLENVANALQMPIRGGYIMALPIKIAGGCEAPVRLVGIKPK